MKAIDTLDFVVFGIYFVVVIGVAMYVARKPKDHTRNAEDYFLAGRSLPWWIIGASLIASNISTEQIIGMNGTAFESGIAVISYSLLSAITILIVAKYFLPKFLKQQIYSMPEFLEKRFDKRVSTIMSIFWILVYVFVNLTSVLTLGAITLKAILGIPILYSIIALACFSAVYTIYGGLSSVAWTDFIQVGVLILGGLSVVWLGLDRVASVNSGAGIIDGFSSLLENQNEKFHTVLPYTHRELPWTGVFLGGLWIAAFSYWGCNQYIIQRALAAKSLKEAQHGLLFAALLTILIAVIIVLPGVIASELFPHLIQARDEAFPVLIRELLPAGYTGLVIAALIAAIISSLNSMCNSVATIFTMDVYRLHINKKAGQEKLITVGRMVTALALILAVLITPFVSSMGKLFAFIQEYTGFVTPGVVCLFMLGLFWKRMSSNAALLSVLMTIPVSIAFKALLPEMAFLNRMMITLMILIILSVVISLRDKKEYKSVSTEVPESRSVIFNLGSMFVFGVVAAFYVIFW